MIHLFHKYKPVAVENLIDTETGRINGFTGRSIIFPRPKVTYKTRVLSQCSCGEIRTTELDGTWTLEQLTTKHE